MFTPDEITNQLSSIDFDYYPFQREDIPWFFKNSRSLNLYEQRLGKTVVTSTVLALDSRCKRVLIACPKNAFLEWCDHITKFFKLLCPNRGIEIRIIRGKGSTAALDRQEIYLREPTQPNNTIVYITSFAALLRDKLFLQLPSTIKRIGHFDTVIGDEVHKCLRNRKTETAKCFKWLTSLKWCNRVHLLSGTLSGKNGPPDLWTCLNLCNPGYFSSYWRLVDAFMHVDDFGYGKVVGEIRTENIQNWYKLLDLYSRRRFRRIERPNMPKIIRSLRAVDATNEQIKLVAQLKSKILIHPSEQMTVISSSIEEPLRLRQILICPKILDPIYGYGAPITDLIERLQDPESCPTDEDKHLVIFTPYAKALPFFEQALREAGFKNIFLLQGGIEPEEQRIRVAEYRRTKGIILCTIKYAEAFSLAGAEQCVFIGYEWDPNENKQAEDRLIPQSGDLSINAFYYYSPGIDEFIAEYVNIKNQRITITIGNVSNTK